jgi:hypothetical protein
MVVEISGRNAGPVWWEGFCGTETVANPIWVVLVSARTAQILHPKGYANNGFPIKAVPLPIEIDSKT